jgi:transposase
MMGQRGGSQEKLFYSFNLDDHVPSDHLLRRIDPFFDLSELRQHLAPYYSNTGRPSIDPELMVRMLIVGYCFGIRSERRLCEEIHLNLAYRWFCLRISHQAGQRFRGKLDSRFTRRWTRISRQAGQRFHAKLDSSRMR